MLAWTHSNPRSRCEAWERDYIAGATLRELAARDHESREWIAKHLKDRHGVTMRPRGRRPKVERVDPRVLDLVRCPRCGRPPERATLTINDDCALDCWFHGNQIIERERLLILGR